MNFLRHTCQPEFAYSPIMRAAYTRLLDFYGVKAFFTRLNMTLDHFVRMYTFGLEVGIGGELREYAKKSYALGEAFFDI